MWRDFIGTQKSEPPSILKIRRFEEPIISTTFMPVDNLPAPVKADKCDNYITPLGLIDDENYPFARYFFPGREIFLHKYEDEIGPYF
ncbi:24579_t:CDS:2, partial [Racocetra persica]